MASSASSAIIVAGHFSVIYGGTGLFGPFTGSPTSNQVDAHPGSPSFIALVTGRNIAAAAASVPVRVTANHGYELTSLVFVAAGDYSSFSFPSVGNVGVSVSGQIRVNPAGTLTGYTSSLLATAPFVSNVAFDFTTHDWEVRATIVLPSGIDDAWVTLEKILVGYSDQPLGYAMIENKFDALVVNTRPITQIPEPATGGLIGLGLIFLAIICWRKIR